MKNNFLVGAGTTALVCFCLIGCNQSSSQNANNTTGTLTQNSPIADAAELAFDVAGFLIKNPVIRTLELFKIIYNTQDLVSNADTKSKTVTLDTTLPDGVAAKIKVYADKDLATVVTPDKEINFSPLALQAKFGLKNDAAVASLDSQMERDFSECTDEVLNNDRINHDNLIEELNGRISCLITKGYGKNERAYMQIKHGFDVNGI